MHSAEHRLRILLAIGIYEPAGGGAAEWLENYARWLISRVHDVCIVCQRAMAPVPEACGLLALPPARHTKNSWQRAIALQQLVKEYPADVVHDTGCLLKSDVFHPLMGSLVHNWYRQLRAFPFSLRVRRFWHVRLWRDVRLQLHQQRQSRLLIACSNRVASDFRQLGCRNPSIIPNGIRVLAPPTTEAVQQLRRELKVGNRLLAVVTANNFYLKGVMTVLRALTTLDAATRGRFLVIVTGNNQDEAFRRYVENKHLGECCRLAGWVENITDYYHAADIFLHPTYHDAGSLSTLKALAAGSAVVTSRFDGSADFIENGVNGMILDNPADAAKLAGILRLLLEVELRERLGTAARELVTVIRQERQFQMLEQLYSGIVTGKRFPA